MLCGRYLIKFCPGRYPMQWVVTGAERGGRAWGAHPHPCAAAQELHQAFSPVQQQPCASRRGCQRQLGCSLMLFTATLLFFWNASKLSQCDMNFWLELKPTTSVISFLNNSHCCPCSISPITSSKLSVRTWRLLGLENPYSAPFLTILLKLHIVSNQLLLQLHTVLCGRIAYLTPSNPTR